jgi:asparagine synthetase B (glutamine-hydrolysing)
MNSNLTPLQGPSHLLNHRTWARWLALLSERPPAQAVGFSYDLVGGQGRARKLYCGYEIGSEPPDAAAAGGYAVVIGGTLYNRGDLEKELDDSSSSLSEKSLAEVVLAGYLRWGEDLLPRLRGPFALIIWDADRDRLMGVRDPLGSHPLFFAEAPGQIFVSPAINVLTRQPSVAPDLNRVAMADLLMQRTLGPHDTFFEAVRRIPAARAMCFERNSIRWHRYWDPAPDGQVNWNGPAELEKFDELFDQAVSRCMSFGPTGIFLSGGLDSVSVAAAAVDLSGKQKRPAPLALSLVFPHPDTNEEVIQRSVAQQLGLPQVVKPFFEATGENGLLRPGLAMNRDLPAPLLNPWMPAYMALASEGVKRGCHVILSGSGGDEWLGLGPFIAADLLRGFDLRGIYRLWRETRLSYRVSGFAMLHSLLWKCGAKPLLFPPTYKFIKQMAPWAIQLGHRLSPKPPPWIPPKWVAPDPTLRRQLERRAEQTNGDHKPASSSFYIHEGKKALDHPMLSWEQEEMFDVYRRAGVRVLQPFWDADLVDLLFRMPPFELNRGGRTKGLVRDSLARRFPTLGFERQRKVLAVEFYRSMIVQDAARIWRELGGAKALKEMGIIDEQGLDRILKPNLYRPPNAKAAHEVLTVLNLESWTRTQLA